MADSRIQITLAIADLAAKHFEITQRISGCDGDSLRLQMPNWIPGSYLIRDFARHVSGLKASDGTRELQHVKEDKATWLIQLDGATSCEINYRVYADELSVRTNDISHDHAFVNPGGSFFSVVDREAEAYAIRIDAPKGWNVHATLPSSGDGSFVAKNYDQLVDSPFEMGPFEAHSFQVAGERHRFVFVGDGNLDTDRIIEDARKICEAEVELFGELPAKDYLFIVLLTESKGGGLEHSDGSVLAWPKLGFRPDKEYRKFLTLVAHEYFHLWNVKRIRPHRFMEIDYRTEVHTKLLWVFEGITSYYDQLIPMRAGVYQPKHYFELMTERIVAEQSRGGRALQSLEESSFDTWTRFYRPTPDSYNTQVSYYERGELVAFLLDLHLRKQSNGAKSLDDVMRYLYSEFAKSSKGLEEGQFAEVVLEATGIEINAFLERYVVGNDALDYEAALKSIGIEASDGRKEKEKKEAWLGAVIESAVGSSRLGHVAQGGSAHQAGLMSGDEIVAMDGHRVRGDLKARIKLFAPGEQASWTSFRRDRLVAGKIQFLQDPHPPIKWIAAKGATTEQREAFEQWSRVSHDAAFAKTES